MRMMRWMCGTSLHEKQRGEDLLQSMGLTKITDEIRQSRLRWYGHVVRREENHWLKKAWRFEVVGPKPQGRPWKTWDETLAEHLRLSNLANVDIRNRTAWNRAIEERQRPIPVVWGKWTSMELMMNDDDELLSLALASLMREFRTL